MIENPQYQKNTGQFYALQAIFRFLRYLSAPHTQGISRFLAYEKPQYFGELYSHPNGFARTVLMRVSDRGPLCSVHSCPAHTALSHAICRG